jgi:diaminopimelate decarboxylase
MTPIGPVTAGFSRRGGVLHCESVPLDRIATQFGTPTYVYSRRAIVDAYEAYARALAGRPSLVCYAMKANSNLAVLHLLARAGAGFDIVSGGELARVLAAGGEPGKIVFSGVGKSVDEIRSALAAGILCFNLESTEELERLQQVASEAGVLARISVRTNPDVDAKTHPYITTGLKQNKFGVALDETLALYRRAARLPNIEIFGIDCHIGSQITEVAPYVDAADKVLDLVDELEREGIVLRHIDFGGGLGIAYRDETPPAAGALIAAMLARVDQRGHSGKHILVEPGRSIVGAAGALLTRVNIIKAGAAKNFAIVDAAMNDLMRPALYQAWMDVQPVQLRDEPGQRYDIVGPVCESGDWLARDRDIALRSDDLVAVLGAGAYGMSMASNYNSRPRAAEVMVDGDRIHQVRRRETVAQLFADESVLPD